MALFDFKPKSSRENDHSIIGKSNNRGSSPIKMKGGETLRDKIKNIQILVEKYLGKYKDEYIIIKDEDTLKTYIANMVKDEEFAIDTETTSLDPMTTTLVGVSLYSLSNKPAYIPLNHISNMTGMRLTNQLTVEQFSNCFKSMYNDSMKPVLFNAKFDMRVLYHQANFKTKDGDYLLNPHFDGYLAGKCLNENEPSAGLKSLYAKYCCEGKVDAFAFDDLFKGISFNYIPMDIGYLYAAHDAKITFELYQYHKQFLDKNNNKCIERNLEDISKVFYEIEMPIIPIIAKMEDSGILVDLEYQKELSIKYQTLLEEKRNEFYNVCSVYEQDIKDFKVKNRNSKIEIPINISSPIQIAELFYDIIGVKNNSRNKPRSTEEKCIKDIDHPAVITLLKYREFEKLMTTYITKMPEIINNKTGKIHCNFNQYGCVTGRFSSSDPNMQNIPAKNKDIRPMFTASPGNVLMSSDYSKQEAIIAAVMSKDEKMLQGIAEGKDIYSVIASVAFNLSYEECCEEHLDGSFYKEGYERRNKAKAIVLGVMYGKGIKAISEDLKVSQQIAQKINDTIMITFPGLQDFMIESQQMAIDYGFVTTYWGRKRRLPDMQLEPYEFSWLNGMSDDFDPMSFEVSTSEQSVSIDKKEKYTALLERAYGYKNKQPIFEKAKSENIKIKENTMLINDAEKQCVNSRVQGSAADLTKIAMRLVGENKRLKELGFKLILQIHDELMAECPKENSEECSHLFSELMSDAGMDLGIRLKCDVEISERWGEKALVIA